MTSEEQTEGIPQDVSSEFVDNVFSQIPSMVELTDRFGNTIHLGNAGDYWHPPLPIGADSDYRTHVRRVREMDLRDDDLLICSFPKSGLHWHLEMVTQLLNKSPELNPEGSPIGRKTVAFLDSLPMATVDAMPSPRCLLTHMPFRQLPQQAFEKKIKMMYLVRNPKDVLVSFYIQSHKMRREFNYPGTFEHFLYLSFECGYYYGDLFDHLMGYQRGFQGHPDIPLHISVYEDMKKDPVAGVERLNDFFDTGCSKQLCEDIARSCSFQKLKAFKAATMPEEQRVLFKNGVTSVFYRKGEVGDWKNWFTVAMNELYEDEYHKRMADYDMEFTYLLC